MGKQLKRNTQPRLGHESDSLVILTAAQAAELRLTQTRHELMGTDFRNHSGARPKVHKNKKKENRRFGPKDKRDALRE